MNVRLNNITINCMLAALLSALFASCTNEIEDEADPLSGKNEKGSISFSTYTGGATRANEVTAEILQGTIVSPGTGFSVSAWHEDLFYFIDNVINGTGTKDGIEAGKDGIYDTQADTYFWPALSSDRKMYFRAFNNLTNGAEWADDKKSLKFTVQQNASEQEDLVVAYAKTATIPDNGVQPLNFTHALSKINFSFNGDNDDYKYTINKVEVIAAGKPSATNTAPVMSFIDSESVVQADHVAWAFAKISNNEPLVRTKNVGFGSEANQGVAYTYDKQKPTDGVADIVVNGKNTTKLNYNFMLLPQNGKIAVRVYYKVEDDSDKLIGNCGYFRTDKNGKHEVQDGYDESNGAIYGCKTLIVSLGTPGVPEWKAGNSYRYTLTLPTDNYAGDTDEDGIPDMGVDDNDIDLDGDDDGKDSEFKLEEDNWIEFSVSVDPWTELEYKGNITIKQ